MNTLPSWKSLLHLLFNRTTARGVWGRVALAKNLKCDDKTGVGDTPVNPLTRNGNSNNGAVTRGRRNNTSTY